MTLGTSAVTFQECDPLGAGEDSHGAAEVQDFTPPAENLRNDACVTGETPQLTDRYSLVGAVDTSQAAAGVEISAVDPHH
ncbi:MAG TPA: hypothetical protein VFC06_05335, partial [Demequina sp.]|nr:hypothetical protein [Demequina sp.]